LDRPTVKCRGLRGDMIDVLKIINKIRRSAVAESARDTLCLSVVSFNSILYLERSLLYFGIRFTNAYNK